LYFICYLCGGSGLDMQLLFCSPAFTSLCCGTLYAHQLAPSLKASKPCKLH